MSDILIIYYSRTGKTRMVAEKLGELLEADVEEIREAKGRSGAFGFLGGVKDSVLKRQAKIVSEHSVEPRKLVIIGMPVWANSPPPAVRAFLEKFDLTGKKVSAFCTYDGSGNESALAKTAKLVPGGLASTLSLKKPRPDDPVLLEQLHQWAEQVRAAII